MSDDPEVETKALCPRCGGEVGRLNEASQWDSCKGCGLRPEGCTCR